LEWDRVDHPAFGERAASEGGDRLSILSVASNGPVLVAVGSEGGIFMDAAAWVSIDGRDWNRVEVPAPADEGSSEQMEGVAAIGEAFVAHGWTPHLHDSVLWFSPDGYTWTRLPASVLGDPTEEPEVEALVAAGPGLIAVGSAWHPDLGGRVGAIWVSETGRDWTRIDHDDDAFGGGGSLASIRADGLWLAAPLGAGAVALGHVNGDWSLLRSADGYDWVRTVLDPEVFQGDWGINAVVAGGPGLVAVGNVDDVPGDERDSDAAIWVSGDGLTWERIPHSEGLFGGSECQGVRTAVANGPLIVALGGTDPCRAAQVLPNMYNRVWISDDGYTWQRVPHDDHLWGSGAVGAKQPITGATAHKGTVVAVGFWINYTYGEPRNPDDPSIDPEVEDVRWGGRVWIATPIDQ
jgi:hypothetical protein